MQRRELIRLIGALTGCAFVGADLSRAAGEAAAPSPYSAGEVEFFDDVADTILPATDTPGARDAAVGAFIARYSAACYSPDQIMLLKSGLADIDARMQALHGRAFGQAKPEEKTALLSQIGHEAKERARLATAKDEGALPHYFTLMKQLTLYGFFTSEPGETRVARYRPIPGPYRGCIPYMNQTFWAW